MKHSVLAALAVSLAVAACGGSSSGGSASKPVNPNGGDVSPPGDIPDNQAFVAYSPPGAAYSVKVPEGWARQAAGGAVTFTDKLNSVRMESAPAAARPSVSEVRRAELPRLARTVKGFKAGTVSAVQRGAGTAIRITYLADAKPDPVTGRTVRDAVERYVFFHSGRNAVLTLSAPKGSDNVDPWRLITDSLRWTR